VDTANPYTFSSAGGSGNYIQTLVVAEAFGKQLQEHHLILNNYATQAHGQQSATYLNYSNI
jgi:hypothetical protein